MGLPQYHRRRPETLALHQVVREHLLTFREMTEDLGRPLPKYVWQELEGLVDCGILTRGFARVHCSGCGYDRLVALSCKGRSLCPSCVGRTMNDTAAYLTDHVIGPVPVRHWICTLPPVLRYLLAHDIALCGEVLDIFVRAVFRCLRSIAKQELGLDSTRKAFPAAVTAVHRASSHLALNVHFHSLVADGVWVRATKDATPEFRGLRPPSRGELMAVSWETCTKTLAALRRRGLWLDVEPGEDRFAQDEPGLAQCYAASLSGVLTVGPRAGQRVLRIGAQVGGDFGDDDHGNSEAQQTPGYGFSVHATRRVSANDRSALERLARYVLRPPLAQERLKVLSDGRVSFEMKRAWSDGTRTFIFEPTDFLAKLAALVFPPRMHRIRYHGAWARRSRLRKLVMPAPPVEEANCGHSEAANADAARMAKRRPRYDWAKLLKRVFRVDVLACPKCGGRMQRIQWVMKQDVIRKILTSVGLPADSPGLVPSRWFKQQALFESA